MSIDKIQAALETAANSMVPPLPTAWRNVGFEPNEGVPWQRITFLMGSPDHPGINSAYREKGIMRFSLFYPLRTGSSMARKRVDLIRSVFKRDTSFLKDEVCVVVDKAPEIADESVTDWFSLVVDVRFRSDVTI